MHDATCRHAAGGGTELGTQEALDALMRDGPRACADCGSRARPGARTRPGVQIAAAITPLAPKPGHRVGVERREQAPGSTSRGPADGGCSSVSWPCRCRRARTRPPCDG
ncbi:DUF6233 domain-containing protein [Streptomyces sp. NPDC021080]|uniref:DUF6233 domain-containing protein n=1 Tax=Streptomyces sp. NPDC021080 TaxID=3365110 RepID=UPI0037955C75